MLLNHVLVILVAMLMLYQLVYVMQNRRCYCKLKYELSRTWEEVVVAYFKVFHETLLVIFVA